MSDGIVILDLAVHGTIQITGITNSASWPQQITVEPSGGPAQTWTGTGMQSNSVVGQYTIPESATPTQLKIQMQYDSGSGFQPSQIEFREFQMPGLSGFVVGGQDGGGRPNGPAYWNTIVFIYFAPPY
ncbi:MAG TPA: hypothetical protein VF266_11270 [Thermoanaerobaculia bacterium]